MNQTVTCDAVRLEGAQRLTFLPDLFGGDFMTSEASVYAYAQRYCPEYQGGFWQFYRLPEGGGDHPHGAGTESPELAPQ